MQSVLVTGETGKLGRAVVDRLDNLGGQVKVLTRRVPGPGAAMAAQHVAGDLRTAEGLDDAVSGASVIVHCATAYGNGDVAAVRHLILRLDRRRRCHSGCVLPSEGGGGADGAGLWTAVDDPARYTVP